MPTPTATRLPRHYTTLRSAAVLFFVALSLCLTGCQTYTTQSADRDAALRSGNIGTALSIANRDAEKNQSSKDAILFRLEQGAILRAAALANYAAPNPASVAPAGTAATSGQTATNAALVNAAPEDLSPRIGHLTGSLAAFDDAARRIDEYEAAARVSVSSEGAALLTNQAAIPYRGRAYDKVMLHTYQALNYLQLADADAARVELNRALQRQRDAVEANAKRIEEARELAEKASSEGVTDDQGRKGDSYDVERAKSDPRTASGLASIEAKIDAALLPYGDYVNPFTTFLDALVFTYQGTDASDLERARKSWERVVNFAPQNPYARADYLAVEPDLASGPVPSLAEPAPTPAPEASGPLAAAVPPAEPTESITPAEATEPAATAAAAVSIAETAESVAAAETASETAPEVAAAAVPADAPIAPEAPAPEIAPAAPAHFTYVIYETGSAPYRDQIRIDIPLFLVTSGISYVGAAFPTIETVAAHAGPLQITTSDGASYPSALVASMDSVVAQDFKNEWPTILTKTLISTATKATIDAILQKQIQDQAGAGGALLFKLATAVAQAAVNIADTRTWRSLPKEFHYARLVTPADRQLTLSAGGLATTVIVEPAAINVVYVKSPGAYAPLLVSQFVLKN